MLSVPALEYYLDTIKPLGAPYVDIILAIRKRFITKERTLYFTREWEETKLTTYLSKYTDKKPNEILNMMVSRLQDVQVSLPRCSATAR